MQNKFILIVTIIIFSILSISVVAQTKRDLQNRKAHAKRILFSPPDKTFSVVAPFRLKKYKSDYGVGDSVDSIKLFGGFKSKMILAIYVVTYEKGDKNINEIPEEKLGGLEFVVGGDDDHDFTERFIRVDGFVTREVVYKNQNAKAIMIDTGERVFILCLRSKNRKDLESKIANRFFTSFHLNRKTKNAIHN
jgi:hypothetical protein